MSHVPNVHASSSSTPSPSSKVCNGRRPGISTPSAARANRVITKNYPNAAEFNISCVCCPLPTDESGAPKWTGFQRLAQTSAKIPKYMDFIIDRIPDGTPVETREEEDGETVAVRSLNFSSRSGVMYATASLQKFVQLLEQKFEKIGACGCCSISWTAEQCRSPNFTIEKMSIDDEKMARSGHAFFFNSVASRTIAARILGLESLQ